MNSDQHLAHLGLMGIGIIVVGLLCSFQAFGFLTTLIYAGTAILIVQLCIYIFAIIASSRKVA